jgi:hypothetical protein
MMLRHTLRLLFLLLLPALTAKAQVVHVTGTVTRDMRGVDGQHQRVALSIPVYIFDHVDEARQQARKYRQQAMGQETLTTMKASDVVQPDYEGHFETDIARTGALIVISEGAVIVTPIDKRLHYDIVIKGDAADGILLKNTDVIGEKRGVKVRELPAVDDGPSLRWDVTLQLPEGYVNSDTRLIFQPVVIDCQTEDTIQYLEPLVGEGPRFHKAQQRQKDYDYRRNDPLASYYQLQLPGDGTVHWSTAYQKPNPDHHYKWRSRLRLEDMTHVYYDDASHEGSCNSRKPWRMLDVSMARREMTLDSRYYEPSRSQLTEASRDLRLTFLIGRDQLTDDSVNQSTIHHLVRELQSYGRQLINVKIQGTASPDGHAERNAELAERRAAKALSMIRPYTQGVNLQTVSPKVYSWTDVADSLVERGQRAEGEELRQYAEAANMAGIRRMMESNPAINEILQHQRIMRCSYIIRQNKVLEPEEALWVYRNDPSYAEGGTNRFSNGDYYNLLTMIRDSAERRHLIERIHRELSPRQGSRYSPFAAYVANCMACYAMAADSMDTELLKPFVDMKSGLEVERQIAFDNPYRYMVNRREIVANQAVMMFRTMKLGTAAHLADKLPATPEYGDIKMFTDLETLFFKPNKTAEEEQRAKRALDYVMQTSAENRAVLSFELAPELGLSYRQVEKLVDSLDDHSAKKWYMKAMIAANSAENSEDDLMELAQVYGVESALRMKENDIPAFLAYLQQAFDLEPAMQRQLYASDVHLSDEQRKEYPYDPQKADIYRQKFKEIHP